MINITAGNYDIYEGQGILKVVVKNDWFLCSNMQHLTNYYPEGTTFTNSDEPVFHVESSLIDKAVDILVRGSNQRRTLLSAIKQQGTIFDRRKP